MDDHYGSWMHDTKSDGYPEKLWVTRKNETSFIFEYESKDHFKHGSSYPIKLPYPFQVYHTIFKIMYYYLMLNLFLGKWACSV